jgi:hypothetical protein
MHGLLDSHDQVEKRHIRDNNEILGVKPEGNDDETWLMNRCGPTSKKKKVRSYYQIIHVALKEAVIILFKLLGISFESRSFDRSELLPQLVFWGLVCFPGKSIKGCRACRPLYIYIHAAPQKTEALRRESMHYFLD